MATSWLKEPGAMEGACGKIIDTEDPAIVIKKIHRRLKHRSKGVTAAKQCEMQQWASSELTPANGYHILFTPRAYSTSADKSEYAMERIDCSSQVEVGPCTSAEILEELKALYAAAKKICLFPCDYELYRQPDGRIALIDFDKFGSWSNIEEVTFPWGLVWTSPIYPWEVGKN